jgi:hypothetical protein
MKTVALALAGLLASAAVLGAGPSRALPVDQGGGGPVPACMDSPNRKQCCLDQASSCIKSCKTGDDECKKDCNNTYIACKNMRPDLSSRIGRAPTQSTSHR